MQDGCDHILFFPFVIGEVSDTKYGNQLCYNFLLAFSSIANIFN